MCNLDLQLWLGVPFTSADTSLTAFLPISHLCNKVLEKCHSLYNTMTLLYTSEDICILVLKMSHMKNSFLTLLGDEKWLEIMSPGSHLLPLYKASQNNSLAKTINLLHLLVIF